jgi:hypothetical protein
VPDEDPIGDTIADLLQRATVPVGEPRRGATGTAFVYNHLLESRWRSDRVIEFLITAGTVAQGEVGEIQLRPDMIEPSGGASDVLLMMRFADQWTHDEPSGAAFMAFAGLHEHGRRQGWRWTTQEVTDGVAARPDDVKRIGDEPQLAYVLGHGAQGGARPLLLLRGKVSRDQQGTIRWRAPAEDGLAGSPVFVPQATDRGIRLVCLGVLLVGGQDGPIATFDLVRQAIAAAVQRGST